MKTDPVGAGRRHLYRWEGPRCMALDEYDELSRFTASEKAESNGLQIVVDLM